MIGIATGDFLLKFKRKDGCFYENIIFAGKWIGGNYGKIILEIKALISNIKKKGNKNYEKH